MRRRLCALLCALALCLSLCPPTWAAGDVCFTAINDTVLPLSSDSMPVWSGGVLYVPYTVFDAGSTGVSLGVSATYSKSSGVVSVFTLRQMMVFDLKEGVCRNQHTGELLLGQAIMRNGKPYLPAARVCSFFNLHPPAYISTDYGYLVRIKNDEVRMNDTQFGIAASASNVLSNRLRDYNQAIQPPPVVPDYPQPPAPEETVEPTATPTYLAFRCDTGEAGATIADILEHTSISALFFFPADQIGRQGALIRRLLGSGHSVGIIAQGETPQKTAKLLELGSQALETVAHTRTHFVLASPDQTQELEQKGWICWNSGTEPKKGTGRSGYSLASSLVRSLPRRGSAVITLDDSAESADIIRHLPRLLADRKYTLTIPRETRF